MRTRIYRLYVGHVSAADLVAGVRQGLLKNNPAGIERAEFQEVGLVEAEGAGTGVLTPGDVLLSQLAKVTHREATYYARSPAPATPPPMGRR